MKMKLFVFLILAGANLSLSSSYSINRVIEKEQKVIQKTNDFDRVDSAKLEQISAQMQKFVEKKKIAGAVTFVAHKGQIVHFDAIGFQNIEMKIVMQKNSVFRIASMTKPFAAAAIMMLEEEGKLNLDDPIEKYLPEFNDMWLRYKETDEEMLLKRPVHKVTIRDALAHIDGLASLPKNVPVNSIAEYMLVVSQQPLLFEPGTKWQYGGAGITAAARIVEVLSGIPYDEFLAKRIFEPLEMTETSFYLKEEFSGRVAELYCPSSDSTDLEPTAAPDWYRFPRPEGGLFSTANDMYNWMQTILNKGIYKGERILSEKSVEEIVSLQTNNLKTGFTEGMGFGLGFGVVRFPQGVTSMLSPGTFGHGGAFGTQYWADPVNKTIYILMIQRKGFGNGDASDVRNEFQRIAAEAIIPSSQR